MKENLMSTWDLLLLQDKDPELYQQELGKTIAKRSENPSILAGISEFKKNELAVQKNRLDEKLYHLKIPLHFWGVSFDDLKNFDREDKAVNDQILFETKNWILGSSVRDGRPVVKNTSRNVILWGDKGCGKTFSAMVLLNEALRARKNCRYYRVSEMFNLLAEASTSRSQTKGITAILDNIKTVDFLLLDELGIDNLSEAQMKWIAEIIDHRFYNYKTTIVTSNINVGESQLSLNNLGMQTVSRLKNKDALVLRYTGEDLRQLLLF